MRFRLGFVTGMATGYYLGAKAGRQRYDQMNRALAKLRRSEAFEDARDAAKSVVEEAADRAKSVVEEGVDKARAVVDSRAGESAGNGQSAGVGGVVGDPSGLIPSGSEVVTDIIERPPGPGGYSSSR